MNIENLPINYLSTERCKCAECGVTGKHYFIDDNPFLYLYKDKWMCEKCLEALNE